MGVSMGAKRKLVDVVIIIRIDVYTFVFFFLHKEFTVSTFWWKENFHDKSGEIVPKTVQIVFQMYTHSGILHA